MEAPKPVILETPNFVEKKVSKIIDINYFEIHFENKVYKLEFGKSEDMNNIIFKMYEANNYLNNKYYLLELNIQNFYNLNMLFKFYQTLDEIYSLLLDILKDKKYSVKSKENYFILILKFSMPGKKNIDINFDLIEKK